MTVLARRGAIEARRRFLPSDPAGLAAWYKADAIAGKNDGDALSQWDDLSGNGRHLVQATGTKQPLYKTGIVNGRPVARFDGANDYMDAAFTLAQPEHVFVVAKYHTVGVAGSLFDGNTGNTMRIYRGSTALSMYAGAGGPALIINPETAFVAYSFLFSGAASESRANGGAPTIANAGTASGSGITLGIFGDKASDPGPVDIAEFIVYSAALSAANRLQVESYLKGRYATA